MLKEMQRTVRRMQRVVRKTGLKRNTKRRLMDPKEIMRQMGRKGGLNRAKGMTPEERRKAASEAGKASSKARRLKAELKKKSEHSQNGYASYKGK